MTEELSFNVVYCSMKAFDRLRGVMTDGRTLTRATLFGVPVIVRPALSGLQIILAKEVDRNIEIVKVIELPEEPHTYLLSTDF